MLEVAVSWTNEADQDLGLPKFETEGAAGADLRANFNTELRLSGITLAPLKRELIPTGLCFEIPTGVEGQLRPRSGLALKHGLTLLNSPGTIDSDYRGPIGLIIINMGEFDFKITHGMRIAQIIFAETLKVQFKVSENLSQTTRSNTGFGSTGTK